MFGKTLLDLYRRDLVLPYFLFRIRRAIWRAGGLFAQLGIPITENQRRWLKLKNKHRGKRAFIIGNGPSVRLEDLEELDGEVIFAMNRFYLAYQGLRMRPTYTCCSDPVMIRNHIDEIAAQCRSPLFIISSLLFNASTLDNTNGIYFYEIEAPSERMKFRFQPFRGLEHGSSVIFVAMQIAVWMGVQRLVLYGIDHDFQLPKGFTEDDPIVIDNGEVNHFIPHYRKRGDPWCPPKKKNIELGFQCALDQCKSHGIEIVNCTRGGKLDIFPRKVLTDELNNSMD